MLRSSSTNVEASQAKRKELRKDIVEALIADLSSHLSTAQKKKIYFIYLYILINSLSCKTTKESE